MCRQTTGALAATFADLKGAPSAKSLEACTRNGKSGWRVDRYHCSTCGTRVFDHATDTGNWLGCSGIVEPKMGGGEHPQAKSENVVKMVSHDFVGDTGDGGLAGIMRRLGDRVIPCNTQGEGTRMKEEELEALSSKPLSDRADSVHASCHCGAVQFDILPPSPDALQRGPKITRWLYANGTKYWGLLCACRSCRLTTGTSFAYQTYVMPENIVMEDRDTWGRKSPFNYTSYDESTGDLKGSEAALRAAFPALKYYYHSEDRRRTFCGSCGAGVFWERLSRPQVVNVAVGLLRAESGCLAKEWVEWERETVWWEEEAVDREMVNAWKEGWRRLDSGKESTTDEA